MDQQSPNEQSFSLILTLFSGFFALVGMVGVFVLASSTYQKYQVISTADTTGGTVVKSEVIRRSSGDVETRDEYDPHVEYRYTVDGQSYENDTVFPAGVQKSLSEEKTRKMVKQYSKGERVKVFYSTRDPASSYLVHVGFQPLKMLVAFLVITVFLGGGGTVFYKQVSG